MITVQLILKTPVRLLRPVRKRLFGRTTDSCATRVPSDRTLRRQRPRVTQVLMYEGFLKFARGNEPCRSAVGSLQRLRSAHCLRQSLRCRAGSSAVGDARGGAMPLASASSYRLHKRLMMVVLERLRRRESDRESDRRQLPGSLLARGDARRCLRKGGRNGRTGEPGC